VFPNQLLLRRRKGEEEREERERMGGREGLSSFAYSSCRHPSFKHLL
jgi:hypothetical protein